MEFTNLVFNAARDGKLNKLKMFLDRRSRNEVSRLVNAKVCGATPLVMATKNGHLACVEYLVERCDADIEQVGSVVFDGETIDGAPPLWCAAAAGYLDVVAYLLRRGANVNATTKTNSTPLRAACFDGHFKIVLFLVQHKADIEVANRHGHTCLMIACYKGHYDIAKYLIEISADVNRKSVKGNTALHDCAESGSLEILKLLLDSGAKMDVDSYGMTPLLAAAVTGHTHIVEYLVSRTDITTKEKIDALELLGATYVDKKRDMLGALHFWKLAMSKRFQDNGLIYKKLQQPSISAYENAVEVTSLQELEEIISDPDEMRMQALLVRERILGPAHPDTSYYIRYRGAVYADTGNFDRCVTLWMYALEMQQKILEPLNPMTQSSFISFAELFSFMMSEAKSRSRRVPAVNFCDVMKVFERCLKEVEVGMTQINRICCNKKQSICSSKVPRKGDSCFSDCSSSSCCIRNGTAEPRIDTENCMSNCPNAERDSTYFHKTLVITLHLICLLTKLNGSLTSLQKETLRRAVHSFIRLDPRGSGGVTPLHLACSRDSASTVGRLTICSFPSYEVIQLLLEVGADPNALDDYGNSPLHTLGCNKQCRRDLVLTLLSAGSHLDLLNNARQSFAQLRQSRNQPLHTLVNPLSFTSLQCLAARAIQHDGIPYAESLHPVLKVFVDKH